MEAFVRRHRRPGGFLCVMPSNGFEKLAVDLSFLTRVPETTGQERGDLQCIPVGKHLTETGEWGADSLRGSLLTSISGPTSARCNGRRPRMSRRVVEKKRCPPVETGPGGKWECRFSVVLADLWRLRCR